MNTSDVVNRLTYHRQRQGPLLHFLRREDSKLGSKLAGCGSWLHIREFLVSGESRIRNANFCKAFLICPCCAARRAGKMVGKYTEKVESILAEKPDLIPAMITLTLRNTGDLRSGLQHLKDSWRRMMDAKRAGKSKASTNGLIEWNKVAGSIRAIEVTNKGKGWHPHIHVFVLLEEYINVFHLSAEWERFTGDSMIVNVKKCYNGIVAGLVEVLKYVSKPSELAPAQLLELYTAAKGARFTDPQGILRGIPEPDIDQDDDEGLDGPFRDYMMLWTGWGYSMQAVGHELEILRPNDPGYGAPRELVALLPGTPEYDQGIAWPPEYQVPKRPYYAEELASVIE